ncbi:hypothetical protein Ciccas_002347 [Cichlidogyrus casuarinus]|uniref:Uncharacterized protein n=1 Tax=Cichlidogyrus casuarinus TaxID=1844966 RepID=A0ABD2QHI6_9PLAT
MSQLTFVEKLKKAGKQSVLSELFEPDYLVIAFVCDSIDYTDTDFKSMTPEAVDQYQEQGDRKRHSAQPLNAKCGKPAKIVLTQSANPQV